MTKFVCKAIQKEGDLYTLFLENEAKIIVFNTTKIEEAKNQYEYLHETDTLLNHTIVNNELTLITKVNTIVFDLDKFFNYKETLKNLHNTKFFFFINTVNVSFTKTEYHLFYTFNDEEKKILCELIDEIKNKPKITNSVTNELKNIQKKFYEYEYGLRLVSLETFTFLTENIINHTIQEKIVKYKRNISYLIIKFIVDCYFKKFNEIAIFFNKKNLFMYKNNVIVLNECISNLLHKHDSNTSLNIIYSKEFSIAKIEQFTQNEKIINKIKYFVQFDCFLIQNSSYENDSAKEIEIAQNYLMLQIISGLLYLDSFIHIKLRENPEPFYKKEMYIENILPYNFTAKTEFIYLCAICRKIKIPLTLNIINLLKNLVENYTIKDGINIKELKDIESNFINDIEKLQDTFYTQNIGKSTHNSVYKLISIFNDSESELVLKTSLDDDKNKHFIKKLEEIKNVNGNLTGDRVLLIRVFEENNFHDLYKYKIIAYTNNHITESKNQYIFLPIYAEEIKGIILPFFNTKIDIGADTGINHLFHNFTEQNKIDFIKKAQTVLREISTPKIITTKEEKHVQKELINIINRFEDYKNGKILVSSITYLFLLKESLSYNELHVKILDSHNAWYEVIKSLINIYTKTQNLVLNGICSERFVYSQGAAQLIDFDSCLSYDSETENEKNECNKIYEQLNRLQQKKINYDNNENDDYYFNLYALYMQLRKTSSDYAAELYPLLYVVSNIISGLSYFADYIENNHKNNKDKTLHKIFTSLSTDEKINLIYSFSLCRTQNILLNEKLIATLKINIQNNGLENLFSFTYINFLQFIHHNQFVYVISKPKYCNIITVIEEKIKSIIKTVNETFECIQILQGAFNCNLVLQNTMNPVEKIITKFDKDRWEKLSHPKRFHRLFALNTSSLQSQLAEFKYDCNVNTKELNILYFVIIDNNQRNIKVKVDLKNFPDYKKWLSKLTFHILIPKTVNIVPFYQTTIPSNKFGGTNHLFINCNKQEEEYVNNFIQTLAPEFLFNKLIEDNLFINIKQYDLLISSIDILQKKFHKIYHDNTIFASKELIKKEISKLKEDLNNKISGYTNIIFPKKMQNKIEEWEKYENFNQEEIDNIKNWLLTTCQELYRIVKIYNELQNIKNNFIEYKNGLKLVSLATYNFLISNLQNSNITEKIIKNSRNTRYLILHYLVNNYIKEHRIIMDPQIHGNFAYEYKNEQPNIILLDTDYDLGYHSDTEDSVKEIKLYEEAFEFLYSPKTNKLPYRAKYIKTYILHNRNVTKYKNNSEEYIKITMQERMQHHMILQIVSGLLYLDNFINNAMTKDDKITFIDNLFKKLSAKESLDMVYIFAMARKEKILLNFDLIDAISNCVIENKDSFTMLTKNILDLEDIHSEESLFILHIKELSTKLHSKNEKLKM